MVSEKKISNIPGAIITVITLMTNTYSVMPGSSAGKAVWVSNLIAAAVSFTFAFLLATACDTYPEETFYRVLQRASGKAGSKVFALLFSVVSLTTLTVSLTVFSRFVQQTSLPQTPPYILPLMIMLIAAFSLSVGMRSFTGSSRLLFLFTVSVFVIFTIPGLFAVISESFSSPFENSSEILPAAGEVFLNRYLAIVPLMSIYTRMESKKTRRKVFLASTLASGLAMTIISVIVVGNLGAHIAQRDFYPVFTVMSSHGVGGFIRHTEIFASVTMTICLFFKSAVGIMFVADMIKGVFDVSDARGLEAPLALILSALTQIIYSDISRLKALLSWKSTAAVAVMVVVFSGVALYLLAKRAKKRI